MSVLYKLLYVVLLTGLSVALVFAGNPRYPSYPSIPSSYEVLHAQKLVADARVDFPSYYIGRTDGYQVKAPNGTEFIVDNIVQPKCAFYSSYVTTGDDGFLGIGGGTQVSSNIYIGEVNFANCQ